jgi:hypothetical protein
MTRSRTATARGRSSRGAAMMEYALVLALVGATSLGAIKYAQASGQSRLATAAPDIGTPNEMNHLSSVSGSPTPTAPPTTIAASPSSTVHVAALSATTAISGQKWIATVTVAVLDATGQPVSGVAVVASWSPATGHSQTTCVTRADGTCQLTQQDMKRSGSDAILASTLTVESLSNTSGGVAYDPVANVSGSILVSAP